MLQPLIEWLEQRAGLVLAVMTALFVGVLFAGLTIKLFGWAQGYDQIDYQQSIWNTTQGRFLEISHYRHTDSLWGMDVIPAILLIVPFYALFPSALTLNFFQALFMGLGALPAYGAARDRFGSRLAGLAFACIYLLYPSTWFATMSAPWQPRTLAVPALIGAFYFLQKASAERNHRTTEPQNHGTVNKRTKEQKNKESDNDYRAELVTWSPDHLVTLSRSSTYSLPYFLLCLLIALSTRTDASLCVIGFGLLAAVWRMGWRWAVPPILVGAAWFIISTSLIVPAFYRADYHPQEIASSGDACEDYSKNWPGKSPQLAYYCHLGGSVGEILLTIVTKPLTVAHIVLTEPKLTYLFWMLLPLLFLPLLAPDAALPALPILAMNLLTNRPFQYIVREQYQTLVIPGLIIAAIVGAARLWEWWVRRDMEMREREAQEQKNKRTKEQREQEPRTKNQEPTEDPRSKTLDQSAETPGLGSDLRATSHKPQASNSPSSIVHRPSSQNHQLPATTLHSSFVHRPSSIVLIGLLLLAALGTNLAYRNPVVSTVLYREEPARIAAMRELAALIPPDAPVAASSFLAPNLMPRREIFYFPNSPAFPPIERATYVFVDLRSAALKNELGQTALSRVRDTGGWRVVAEKADLILFERVR